MTTANMSDPNTVIGAPVHSTDGERLGKITSVYFDNETDRPAWAAVKTGLFGGHVSLVPLDQGTWDGNALTVPFDKAALNDAPHHDPEAAITASDEEDLYRYYGLGAAGPAHTEEVGSAAGDPRRDRTGEPGIEGRDISGPTTDEAMTRSEEKLHVGTELRQSGQARLRKHIVTENVATTVPVSHEEVTVEREPITDANRGEAMTGPGLSEEEHELTLTEERAVVHKETVPVERIRLGRKTVTEQQQVDETVRKEQIETEGVDPGLRDPNEK
ncbi:PRC and DUF2382 domain-containing protein [Pseudonocardia adelaidensis]|uniref:PRC and DUF2382 domain-containing protein n=2 Tax=Pseudonocardia adelaidensis TaxID=648754 RepID=A0ABP9NIH3_9PSEU